MTRKNRFVILVKTDAGDIVPSPQPYDNTWPTRAQAEQEAARRDKPVKGKYIVIGGTNAALVSH